MRSALCSGPLIPQAVMARHVETINRVRPKSSIVRYFARPGIGCQSHNVACRDAYINALKSYRILPLR
jgi:hypothetical protein